MALTGKVRPRAVTVLERYLLREILAAWAAVTVVLLLILVSSFIGRFLAQIASGEVPGDLLFSLLALKTVGSLGLLLPASLFLSAMLALGRLYRDSEMVVMSACGVGPGRLYRALAWLCIPGVLGLAAVTLWLAPEASATSQALREEAARNANVTMLQPGRFQLLPDGRVAYVGGRSDDGREFTDVIILGNDGAGVDVVTAERGRYFRGEEGGRRYVVLESGHRARGEPGRADFRLLDFARNTLRLPRVSLDTGAPELEARNTAALLSDANPGAMAELHWRLAQPVSLIVLALLVVPASRVAPRESRYSKLVLGVLLYLAYANLLGLGRVWIEQGQMPETLGLWWVHGAFATGALLWTWLQFHQRPVPAQAVARP